MSSIDKKFDIEQLIENSKRAADNHSPYDDKLDLIGGQEYIKRLNELWQRHGVTPFPLDRMKLDGTGTWNGFWYDDPEKTEPAASPAPVCNHEWVDVGFMHSKFVCAKCDEPKPESE